MKRRIKSSPSLHIKRGFFFNNLWVSLGLLFLFWFFLFRELLTGKSWLYDDFPYAYYPGKVLASVSLSKGIFPFWNPYQFGGMPFFADPQIAILYPFNFILFLFVRDDTLNPLILQITILLHFLIASISCFFVGKELKLNNFASLIFGLVFSYSSYMIIHAIHMNLLESVSLLPLLFLMYLKFVRTYKYIYMITAGIIMSLIILAGYPQTYFFIYLIIGILFLRQIYVNRSQSGTIVKRLLLGLIIYIVISAGISAVQVLPTLEFSQYTERINIGYEFAKQGSLHPLDLLTLIVPKIFGTYNWNQSANELSYWSISKIGGHQEGAWMYTVSTLYITLLPVFVLIPFLRFAGRKAVKMPVPVMFYLILIVFVILFAFGGNFFLHKLFFLYVPLFNRFRNPGHISFIFTFFTALLSGLFINELLRDNNSLKKYFSNIYFLTAAVLIVLIFILVNSGFFKSVSVLTLNNEIYNWIVKQTNISCLLGAGYTLVMYLFIKDKLQINTFSILLMLILLIDIYLFAFNQNNGSTSPQSLYSQNTELRNNLKEELKQEPFRVNMRDGSYMLFQRYQGSVDKIPLLEGYNVLLLQKRYPFNKTDSASTQTFDLMNIKYKIKVDKIINAMELIPNPTYLPKAKMFYDTKIISDDSLMKKYMESSEFDYRNTLVLEKNPGFNVSRSDTSTLESSARVTEYDLNKINIEADTPENGFLFLSEVYYPAWKAYVDGRETEIYRTDYSLRSVYVEKGKHKIEFVYDSNSFKTGLKITISTIIVTILGLIIPLILRRKGEKF